MEFSDNIPGVQQAVYSPDSKLIAITNGIKILIKSSENLQNLQVIDVTDVITNLEFSPDSNLLVAVMAKRSICEIFFVQNGAKVCSIVDQAFGILNAKFSPDSRSLMTFSDCQTKATIYNLVDKTQCCIKNPKFPNKGLSFSSNGKFMAIAERKEAKDYIGIYHTQDWKLINHFQVDTMDLQDIEWSKDNSFILAWDCCLQYKLLAYCPAQGKKASISPYDYALGIKSVALYKNSNFIAVGSYDEKIRLINTLTWKVITEFEHRSNLRSYEDNFTTFNEILPRQNSEIRQNSYYDRVEICKIHQLRVNNIQADQPIGIEQIQWSQDSNFIASKSTNMPNTIWIWDVSSLTLKAVLNHIQPVTSFTWNKNSPHLAISTGKNKIFFYQPDGASICDLPFEGKPFNVNQILWANDSKSMVLLDKNDAIIAFPPSSLINKDSDNQK